MKNSSFLIGILLLVSCASLKAQVYSTTKGEVVFFSSAPLEDITAKNSRIISILNAVTGELTVRVPINQFDFPNKLMEQHFNENYMESEKYPYGTFKGKLNEQIDFSKPGTYDATASGVLNIHGVDQKRTLNGKVIVGIDGSLELQTKFTVALADHKIDIPKIVFNKISEKITVTTNFKYQPFKK